MRYPVTRDPDNKTEVIELDLSEVIYIDTGERFVVFHTIDDVFYPLLPRISVLEPHLGGMGFRKMDRTNLVNTSKIKHYDHGRSVVFFEEPLQKNSKFATISFSERTWMKRYMGKSNNSQA